METRGSRGSKGSRGSTGSRAGADMTEALRSVGDQLRFAIAKKRLIEVRYHGKLRLAEPHDYGVQNGKERLLMYQKSARPQERSASGWRLLDVSTIESCTVLDETFPGSRGKLHRNHLRWEIVYVRVD